MPELEPSHVDDVLLGCAMPEAEQRAQQLAHVLRSGDLALPQWASKG